MIISSPVGTSAGGWRALRWLPPLLPRILPWPSLAAGGDRHGRPIRRVALFRQARSISSWIPRRLLWHPDELSDPGLGESGHGKDSDDGAGGYGILGDCHYFRHHCFHRPLYYPLRALGRSLDRFFPVHS